MSSFKYLLPAILLELEISGIKLKMCVTQSLVPSVFASQFLDMQNVKPYPESWQFTRKNADLYDHLAEPDGFPGNS